MNNRTFRYRKARIARWATRFGKEFPFSTKLEKEIKKGLGTMPWYTCHDRDAIETRFYVFMEVPISLKHKDYLYYYGRIFISAFVLYKSARYQREVLRREVEEILDELFTLIKKDVESGKITGRVWEHARREEEGNDEESSTNSF